MQSCYGPHYVELLDPDEMLHFRSYTVHQNTHLTVNWCFQYTKSVRLAKRNGPRQSVQNFRTNFCDPYCKTILKCKQVIHDLYVITCTRIHFKFNVSDIDFRASL